MVASSSEIKKKIISSILDFSLNIDANRRSGNFSAIQINEMLSLAIEINNLINFLDKDPDKLKYVTNLVRPELSSAELHKIKRVLDLSFKYNSDINSIAIDIGENLSTTNRYLSKGIDYLFLNLKSKNFTEILKRSTEKEVLPPSAYQKQTTNKNNKVDLKPTRRRKKKPVGMFSFVFVLGILVAMSLFLYNTFFDKSATQVSTLMKEYRSDQKLSSVTRPSLETTLKVNGTRSVLNIFYDLENNFKSRYPRLDYKVDSGDSGIAIRDLIEGDISLAASSRIPSVTERRKAAKRGKPIADHKIALDSVVFFVNSSNPIEVLSLDEIKQIYKEDSITWSQASNINRSQQKITRFSLSKQSGTYAYFLDRVMYGEESSSDIIHIYTPGQMLEMVAANPNAIGFCSLSVFKNKEIANRNRVKIIRISSIFDDNGSKPIKPNRDLDIDLIKRGEYPLTRYLYLVSAGELTDAQAKFIDFIRSPEAQSHLIDFGLVGII